MIQLSGAGKRFGPKLLFEDFNWMITAQDRAGLVGANGSGKTTLLKVLGGIESLDYGKLSVTRGVSSGYLPQDGLSLSGRSVFAECMSVFASLQQMEVEMEELTHKMGELDPAGPEYAQVADRFHQLDSEFRTRDGYAIEAQVGTVLSGLGFPHEEWNKRTEEFSGGWQMRIALAKLLLEKPNLLLLDEPTNHLDLEARNWLEQYLANYPFAYVLISHDRYFLDVTVNKIVEIWNRGVHFYSGNYEKFLRQKQERTEQLEAAYRNQRERIEHLEAFINRFRYTATKAKQVQSRIKELDKIERIELPNEEKTIHFSFPQPKPSGRIVAEFHNVSKSYGDKFVFGGVDFIIERGDRIALVGVNGAGKSTLIKLLAGSEPLSSGEYRLGHNAEVDYFAQDQYKELDPNSRMLDDLQGEAPRSTNTELRSLLGCFLFSEDDVFKRIGVLSGGERNRYALARMLLQPSNFLLLDEPTNHLDMRAKDVLLESLEKYTGTVVFVSHDRYFIDKLATRIFEVGAGEVKIFPGNYEDYIWRKDGKQIDLNLPTNGHSTADPQTPIPNPVQAAKRSNPLKAKKLQDRARELEAQIAALESEIAADENSLANFVSAEETIRVSAQLEKRRTALEALLAEWEASLAGSMSDFQEQLAHLRKRIARIDKRYTRPTTKPPIAKPQPPIPAPEDWLHGEEITTPYGVHYETERLYERQRRHGSVGIVDLESLSEDLLGPISNGQIRGVPPEKWCFLDTETTGLAGGSGTYAFLVGVGRITPLGFRVRQFFMRDFGEEASSLSALSDHLKQFDVLITYNGRTYDQPLLETRYRMVRQQPPFSPLEHLDLLFGARHLWNLRFDSCRLVELENQILGVERQGDLPGEMIPYVYFEYVRTQGIFRLMPVFHHNAIDILTLACLTAIVPRAFHVEQAEFSHGAEMVGLARWWRQAEQHENALALFRQAVQKNLSDDLLFRTLWDIAALEKKLGREHAALPVLTDLAASRNPWRAAAFVELAKYYERRERNYALALEMTRSAMELESSEALERRAARLEKRVAVPKTSRLI